MILTAEELRAITAQAVEEYPSECCGVIMALGEQRQLLRFRNVQDEMHAHDPERYPRTARTAYTIGPRDQFRMIDLENVGYAVAVIYHSHVDAGAYFSPTDKRVAMLGRDPREHDPAYPDAVYVVASVTDGGLDAVAGFRWDPHARDFTPVDLGLTRPVVTEGRP